MAQEYQDEKQRLAVCVAQLEKQGVRVKFAVAEPTVLVRFVTGELFKCERLPIACADEEKRLIYGVAMEPDVIDAHGEATSKEEIEKAAHGYMAHRMIGIQHEDEAPAELVESFLAPHEMRYGDQVVSEGSWIIGIKVMSDDLWQQAKAGKFDGVSIGGWAQREQR